jgi:hypothetical protein
MNFPIYNNDYQFTLSEIVKYIKFFYQHIVYLDKKGSSGYIETNHQFLYDGLYIKLYWKQNKENINISQYTKTEAVLKHHKNKDIGLLKYDIVKYSNNTGEQVYLPTEESREIFFKKVLRNRLKKSYSIEEYHKFEFETSNKINIPDVFFDSITEEVRNILAFEKYYIERNKQ